MLDIDYVENPGNACALSCYTMTAKFFFPEKVSFDKIAKISDWHPGYVVWGFKFWTWIMDKGVKITNYEVLDYEKWAEEGIEGLKKSISKKEFKFLYKNTKDLEEISVDLKKTLEHKNFIRKKRNPTMKDLVDAYNRGAVCEVVLNPRILDEKEGFSLHRVEILHIDDKKVVFHDPRNKIPMPFREETRELFKRAWLKTLESPELCVYEF